MSFSLFGLLAMATSAVLADEGVVNSFGADGFGQLGNNATLADSNAPVAVSGSTNVVNVASGDYHGLAVLSDGTVKAWGRNSDGQLGNGSTTNAAVPVNVSTITNIFAVAAGTGHSLALRNDGTVWAWGLNANGQLGDGSTTTRTTAVQVMIGAGNPLTGIVHVAAGGTHSIALRNDGTVWAWGANNRGQLGDGTLTQRANPVQVLNNATGLGLTGIISISGGFQHSLACAVDGKTYSWGANGFRQLGDGTITDRNRAVNVGTADNAAQVAAGQYFSLVLRKDGTVIGWGYNFRGQLGDGTNTNRSTASVAVGLTQVVAIAAGSSHSAAVRHDGTLWTWGLNDKGQLGNGNNNNTNTGAQVASQVDQSSISAGFAFTLTVQSTKRTTNSASPNMTAAYGAPIKFNGILRQNNMPILQRAFSYTINGNDQGTGMTNYGGRANIFATNVLDYHVGTHNVGVSFAGDRHFTASSRNTAILTITKANTSIIAINAAGAIGTTQNLRAILRRSTNNGNIAGATLKWMIGDTVLGTAVTDGTGTARLPYKLPETYGTGAANAQTLTVSFDGDSDHNGSTKNATLTINKSQTRISASSTGGKVGATVTLKGFLKRYTDSALLAGKTIRFAIDGVEVGTGVTNADGLATFAFTVPNTLTLGQHIITVTFDEDDLYLGSTNSSAKFTVFQ
jgi:alpha-tubulin suppressor-like RCC1 family protein